MSKKAVSSEENMIVLDWLPAVHVVRRGLSWLKRFLDVFSKVGNTVVYHNPTSWRGVYYYSEVFDRAEDLSFDPLEAVLRESESRGLSVFIGYHWVPDRPEDMWICPSEKEIESAIKVIDETYRLYSSYKSLKGYYAVWEPGDLDSVEYFRRTSDYVKSLDKSLLTAVAPYIFSSDEYYGGRLPLIFNALAEIESLDIIIAQSSVCVYPYPSYQGRDHLLLAKASLGSRKALLGHVETFGRRFLEEEYSSPELVRLQVLSESLVYGIKGMTSFTFTYLIDEPTGRSLPAYMEALKDFIKIQKLIKTPPEIGLFLPRRPEYWAFAQHVLRLLRRVGVDLSLIQLPLHSKGYELEEEVSLIVLADPSELDSEEARFLEKYVEEGGTLLVTGYPPTGLRSLLGVNERNVGKYGGVEITVDFFKRNSKGKVLEFGYRLVYCPKLEGAEPLAVLRKPKGYKGVVDIGGYAATLKKYGKGIAVFTGVPAKTLLSDIPSFFLDLVDLCLSHKSRELKWELRGLNELIDTVTRSDLLVVLNHGKKARVEAVYCGDLSNYDVLASRSSVVAKGSVFEIELDAAGYCCIRVL